jgi:rare lipoprotein A
MLRRARQILYVTAIAGLAAACASTPPPPARYSKSTGAGGYKVGAPYQIGDTWYYPHEQPDYDETGIASWYGPTFYGKPTANGELFVGDGLTAAHRTLPMPVNVRVTNLENGKSVVVRVNDRGPYAKGRIIDVSKRAAELLGFYAHGTAKVRVTYLGKAPLLNGAPASDSPYLLAKALQAVPAGHVETASLEVSPHQKAPEPQPVKIAALPPPPASPTPSPPPSSFAQPDTGDNDEATTEQADEQVTTVPVPAVSRLYVQAGAFETKENASRLKGRLAGVDGLFISPVERDGKSLYRVRSGPYDDLEAANAALARLTGLGNNDAQIVVDQ